MSTKFLADCGKNSQAWVAKSVDNIIGALYRLKSCRINHLVGTLGCWPHIKPAWLPTALISPFFAQECMGNPSIHCCQAVHILSPVVSSSSPPSLKSSRVSMVLASIIPLHSDLSGGVRTGYSVRCQFLLSWTLAKNRATANQESLLASCTDANQRTYR